MTQQEKYPELEVLIAGWFHQDWAAFGDTVEDVIQDYKNAVNSKRVNQVCLDMNQFITEYGPEIETAFKQRWGWLRPAGLGYTIPEFFEELKRILTS